MDKLADRMKKGDERAAAELFDELSGKVFGFCLSRVGNRETAEDLTQSIFLKLLERIDAFDSGRGHFVVWFWRLVRNAVIDYYREKKPLPFSSFEDEEVETMAYAEPAVATDTRLAYENLTSFLCRLSGDERQLFEMRYVAELSYREISKILDKSEVSLRVAMSRLKKKIRGGLNHQNEFI